MTTTMNRNPARSTPTSSRRKRSTRNTHGAAARQGRRVGAVAAAAVPLSEQFLGERERAHRAIGDAMKELLRRKGNTVDPVELERLTDLFKQLEHKDVELKAIEVQELLDSAAVRDAVARLRSTTDKLESTAQEMKQAVDAVRKATQVLGFVDAILGAVGFLRGA